MELAEAQAAPHTKIGPVIYVTDKCFSVEWPLENPFCSSAPWKWPMPLQDITPLLGDQVWMGWHMLSMSSTEENRHTQSISSHTRSWSRKLLHRRQQPQSRRPSECPLVKPDQSYTWDWITMDCFQQNQYSVNPWQPRISCLSFMKHCYIVMNIVWVTDTYSTATVPFEEMFTGAAF